MLLCMHSMDYEGLTQIAHKMKSPIGLYSIQKAHDMLRKIEKLSREREAIAVISPLVNETIETLYEVKRKMKVIIK